MAKLIYNADGSVVVVGDYLDGSVFNRITVVRKGNQFNELPNWDLGTPTIMLEGEDDDGREKSRRDNID